MKIICFCFSSLIKTKVVQDNFRYISTNSLILVSGCRGSYGGYVKHKRNGPMCDPWDSQGDEKNAISISTAFCLDFLTRNENITSEECKTKTF